MSGLIFGFFICNFLIVHCNKKKILRFISIPNHLFTFTHKKKSVNIFHFYKLPSKASGLKYLIISYVDKLFLKQKIQFHISNDLVAYSSYSFKHFNIKLYLSGIDVIKLFYLKMFIMYGNAIFTKEFIP